ncbi:outer membrane beta-barrel protein [Lewinella sp. IMCC34191]|uniref:outer membrane beta-barrel protein n=1 Tax=Lewinella sp. IMCC34191 TaxID=2259172 RepID=UPI000E23F51C|nr:outer membrane beta-barrel protein [Lewinella sp. IMCC34191]
MRSTFTLLCFCLSLFAHAQIQRGDQIITLQEPSSTTGPAPIFNAYDFGESSYVPSQDYGQFYLSPTFGYALTDRLVVGGTVLTLLDIYDRGWIWEIGLNPYLRYYAINGKKLGLYGQVSTVMGVVGGRVPDVIIAGKGFYGFETATLRAGLQLPLATDVRFGPVLDYQIEPGRNLLALSAQIEIVLRRGGEAEATPVSTFRAGSVMLGGQLAGVGLRKNLVFGNFRIGGHYFLTNRLAAGLSLGASSTRFGVQTIWKGVTLSTDVSARYYVSTGKRLVWYAEAGGGYYTGRQWNDDQFDSPNYRGDYFSVTGAVGGQYFVRDNFALEFGPQWREVLDNPYEENSIDLNIGARFLLR